ncbi:MAG TPA: hypothetical protein VLB06_07295 [Sulfuricaulis sp.]|nr:hypothetical protein [Sulfuricaulis sp.]
MNKVLKKSLWAALSVVGVAANQVALADTATCTGANCNTNASPLPVVFTITIPTFLRFQIGAASPGVQWTNITAANLGVAPVNANASTNAGPGAAAGSLYYALLSNNGSTATINATGTGLGIVNGGNTIPYSDISATTTVSVGAGINFPPEGGTTVVPAAGVINESGFWNFVYANTLTNLPGGVYSGTINYTVTQP